MDAPLSNDVFDELQHEIVNAMVTCGRRNSSLGGALRARQSCGSLACSDAQADAAVVQMDGEHR